jgi:hypothetical protein
MIDLFPSPSITLPSKAAWFYRLALGLVPQELEDVVTWADKFYRVVNKDCDTFKSSDSPWLIEPLRMADDPLVSSLTFVKPIQTGGTSLGEIILLRRILDSHGQLSYLWPTNDKSKDRWEKWTEKRIRACAPVRRIMPYEYENMLIKFPGLTFAMQGVFTSGNLDSDTVDFIINEEVHQWEKGMLAKAKGRQTRVDFPKFITISNAGWSGDELHTDFNNGTQQHYENYCPGCGKTHVLRTRWEDQHPELGGLRYDSEGCRRADGTFDYNRLVPTIRYQMPCGYSLKDDIAIRRESAAKGQYSSPFNTGALLTQRSYTYQAVACHNIRWLDLIQEKHNALRSLKTGDDSAWRQYLQERESVFYAPDSRPFEGLVVTTPGAAMTREGWPDRALRLAVFDWQQGYKHKGELIHYWGVILDVKPDCNALVVWEGKLNSESELLELLKEYQVEPVHVLIDASKNTKQILQFCYQNEFKTVMGNASHVGLFRDHPDKVARYYSAGKPIHAELNVPPRYEYVFGERQPNGDVPMVPDPHEPLVIMFNKGGVLGNLFYYLGLKQRVAANCAAEKPPREPRPDEYFELVIPGDVSEEFLKQLESWEPLDKHAKAKRDDVKSPTAQSFRQISQADHMLMCLGYAVMYLDWCFLLGDAIGNLGIKPQTEIATETQSTPR